MSNFHDFDEDQISWKLAQREFFVFVIAKILFIQDSLDDS